MASTQQRVTRTVRGKRKTASQVMREATEDDVQETEPRSKPICDLMLGLVGVIHSGDPEGSADMGRKFAKLLKDRRGP
jgi:hypothetical protein